MEMVDLPEGYTYRYANRSEDPDEVEMSFRVAEIQDEQSANVSVLYV